MTTLNEEVLESELDAIELQLKEILEDSIPQISDILPSDWTEQKMIMKKPFPGPFRYSRTPYTREIIDCLSQSVPVHTIVVMKGAQIGFSSGVIYPGIGWIIENNPGNTLLMVGAPDLIEKSMEKVDLMIDSCGLRSYIQSQSQRKRNNKTGDTNEKKDFPNGYVSVGSANNHKNIRQIDVETQFIDDFEAIKTASKESGSTQKKLEGRSAAYEETRKNFLISTPERKETSNIEPAYLKGDQRKFHIPCQCCKQKIILEWSVPSQKVPNKMAGITWGLKENGQLDPESVGYTCQFCDGFFTEKNKMEWLNKGEWKATAQAKVEGYRSYHISALYAPIGMYGWAKYIGDYIDANPPGQPRVEELWQVFVNECLGETYESPGSTINANQLLLNISEYECSTDERQAPLPERLSEKHGNGKIVLLTCAADLGGRYIGDQIGSTYDDARLDWQIVAHAESGSTYSIDHGSIGTFQPAHMNIKNDAREKWSYDISKANNVWREMDKILSRLYVTDSGRKMKIQITGIDTGFAEQYVWSYVDRRVNQFAIIGLKGDKEHRYIPFGDNSPNFKQGQTYANLYILKVGKLKDALARRIGLKWDKYSGEHQPPGFINFPQPGGTPEKPKYSYEHFFLHYESEERKMDKNNNFIWQKKTSNSQNHFFDTDIYNMAIRDILVHRVFKELGADPKQATWTDFCNYVIRGR